MRRLAVLLLAAATGPAAGGGGGPSELLTSGRPEAALAQAREQGGDSFESLLVHGMAAAATARLPKHESADRRALEDEAVSRLGEAVQSRPGSRTARQELARALFDRGRCHEKPRSLWRHILGDDCDTAAHHLRRALAGEAPEAVRRGLNAMLDAVQRRKRLHGHIGVAAAPDTNVNTQGSETKIRSRLRDREGNHLYFDMEDKEEPSSGLGLSLTGGAELRLPLAKAPDTRLRLGARVARRDYPSSEHDSMSATVVAGVQQQLPRASLSVLAKGERTWHGGRPTGHGGGPRIEAVALPLERVRVSVSAERIDRRFRGRPRHDGPRTSADLSVAVVATPNLVVGGRTGRTRTKAQVPRESSGTLRYGLFAEYEPRSFFGLDGVDLSLAADRSETRWDAPGYGLFVADARRDRTEALTLGAGRRKWEWRSFTPSLILVRERRRSNLAAFYDYERTRAELAIRRRL